LQQKTQKNLLQKNDSNLRKSAMQKHHTLPNAKARLTSQMYFLLYEQLTFDNDSRLECGIVSYSKPKAKLTVVQKFSGAFPLDSGFVVALPILQKCFAY